MSDQRQMARREQAGKPPRHYRRLQEALPVEYSVEFCLPARSRYSSCRLCEQSCPVSALQLSDQGVEVNASCTGCGQCAAACPTEALALPGFAVLEMPDRTTDAVFIDCWKVAPAQSPKNAVRIPCIGGLSVGRLLELVVEGGGRRVTLLDRGWCDTCASGTSDKHPAAACLEAARELLQSLQTPSIQWPDFEFRPLPVTQQATTKTDRSSEQRLSRRAFFGELSARVTNTATEINPLTSGKQSPILPGHARQPARSRERDRLLAQIQTLSRRSGAAMPSILFPAIDIDAQRCQHHRLCAVSCPTGALVAVEVSGVSGLGFDATACIACGECEAICAEGALRLLPHGDGQVPSGPKIMTRVRQRACLACGRAFEGSAGQSVCATCEKRSSLAQSAFQSLFGGQP
jgi:ferredoxin